MIDLYLLVEGQTEEAFAKTVLGPHLARFEVAVTPIVVKTSVDPITGQKRKGGGRWKHWHEDLHRLTSTQRRLEARFSTLFDLYGLPGDFPGLAEHGANRDTLRRAASLEAAMSEAVGDRRFIPYLQRHEFEALVLACLPQLAEFLEPGDRPAVDALRATLGSLAPEEVNDGPETAPSKRLLASVPGYRKTLHGVFACELAGLPALRAACPRFDGWVSRLEALGG